MTTDTIHYRLPGRTNAVHPGAHRGYHYGAGMEFMTHFPLWRLPDAKRIDIRASLCNPMQELLVRVSRQKAEIPVVIVADLSASLGTTGKRQWLADFVRDLGFSVNKTGDRFSFIGCDENLRKDFKYLSTRQKKISEIISQRIRNFHPVGKHSEGLMQVNTCLPQKSLVFLVSDYYFHPELLDKILTRLSGHFVVPVVLANPQNSSESKRFSMAKLRDSETGRTRLFLSTARTRDRIRQREIQHLEKVASVCRVHGYQPLLIKSAFRARDITNYFFPLA